jgi:hypothetical protein
LFDLVETGPSAFGLACEVLCFNGRFTASGALCYFVSAEFEIVVLFVKRGLCCFGFGHVGIYGLEACIVGRAACRGACTVFGEGDSPAIVFGCVGIDLQAQVAEEHESQCQ